MNNIYLMFLFGVAAVVLAYASVLLEVTGCYMAADIVAYTMYMMIVVFYYNAFKAVKNS